MTLTMRTRGLVPLGILNSHASPSGGYQGDLGALAVPLPHCQHCQGECFLLGGVALPRRVFRVYPRTPGPPPPSKTIKKSRRENAAARILALFSRRDLPRGPRSRKKQFSKNRPSQKTTFFQKVDLICGLSPIHKDENDRKWIL